MPPRGGIFCYKTDTHYTTKEVWDMNAETLQNISHFIWDFDGTLLDTYPVVIEDIQKALQDFGYYADGNVLMEKLLNTVDFTISYCAQLFKIDKDALYRAYLKHQNISNATLNALPMEGVQEALAAIQNRGGANYVFTHRPLDATMAFLNKYDLTKYFTDFIAPHTPGFVRKPAPDAIWYLMKKHGIKQTNAVMIGDRELDLASGKNAGIGTMHYVCKVIPQTLDCDLRIESFAELTNLLQD